MARPRAGLRRFGARRDDADPALATSLIADIVAAAIAAVGGAGTVTSIETDRDDNHEFSGSVVASDAATDDDDESTCSAVTFCGSAAPRPTGCDCGAEKETRDSLRRKVRSGAVRKLG
ncbi:MAG: hypothetical protein CMJ89_20830 [Planctomycetes bacterium]|nr:hypothetical protein [Planctomycetota bacterium]